MVATLVIEQYRSKLRLFKRGADLIIGETDDQEWDGTLCSRPGAVIVIRCTTTSEVLAVPCSLEGIQELPTNSLWLTEIMKRLPILGSCNNLDWLASGLSVEWACKFPRQLISDRDHTFVFFFDLEINQPKPDMHSMAHSEVEGNAHDTVLHSKQENWKEKVYAFLSSMCKGIHEESEEVIVEKFKVNEELNVEEIEDYLLVCPEMVVKGRWGMEEAKGAMEVEVLGSVEEEIGCPICLERMCVGDRFATTSCSHRFHRDCIYYFLLFDKKSRPNKKTCPMCRSPLDVYA